MNLQSDDVNLLSNTVAAEDTDTARYSKSRRSSPIHLVLTHNQRRIMTSGQETH